MPAATINQTKKERYIMNYPLPKEPWKPINLIDIPTLEAHMRTAKGTPEYDTLKSLFDGPDHGLDYIDETGKFRLADGWHVADNGDIVRD